MCTLPYHITYFTSELVWGQYTEMNQDEILTEVSKIAITPLPDKSIQITKIVNRPLPLGVHTAEATKEEEKSIVNKHMEYYRRIWKVFALGKEYGKNSMLLELKEKGKI